MGKERQIWSRGKGEMRAKKAGEEEGEGGEKKGEGGHDAPLSEEKESFF